MRTSKNGISWFSSNLIVKLIFGCLVLRYCRNLVVEARLSNNAKVSSTYLNQMEGRESTLATHFSSKLHIEFEENYEIPFLDVRVKRNLSTFTTTVHRKTTVTGLNTKWDSFTPRKYKINVIRTLTYRCLRICSSSSLLQ